MLSKEVSSTIFKVFGMTRPGIEPRSPRPLANTLPSGPMSWSCQYPVITIVHFQYPVITTVSFPYPAITTMFSQTSCDNHSGLWTLPHDLKKMPLIFFYNPSLGSHRLVGLQCTIILFLSPVSWYIPSTKEAVGIETKERCILKQDHKKKRMNQCQ